MNGSSELEEIGSASSTEKSPQAYVVVKPKHTTKKNISLKHFLKDEINEHDVSDNEMKLWSQYLNRTKSRASNTVKKINI